MTETAASRFAEHALGTRFADLPPAAVERAKVFVLDSLGVGIAGSSVEGAEALLEVAAGWGAPRPLRPPCRSGVAARGWRRRPPSS